MSQTFYITKFNTFFNQILIDSGLLIDGSLKKTINPKKCQLLFTDKRVKKVTYKTFTSLTGREVNTDTNRVAINYNLPQMQKTAGSLIDASFIVSIFRNSFILFFVQKNKEIKATSNFKSKMPLFIY